MFVEGSSCPVSHSVAGPFGDHQVGCGGNGDRIYRHDALRDAVFSAAQKAAIVPRREMPSLIPDTQRRPAVQGHALLVGEERKLAAHSG